MSPEIKVEGKVGGYNYAFGVCVACGGAVPFSKYWQSFIMEDYPHDPNPEEIAPYFHPWADKPLCGPPCAAKLHEEST